MKFIDKEGTYCEAVGNPKQKNGLILIKRFEAIDGTWVKEWVDAETLTPIVMKVLHKAEKHGEVVFGYFYPSGSSYIFGGVFENGSTSAINPTSLQKIKPLVVV